VFYRCSVIVLLPHGLLCEPWCKIILKVLRKSLLSVAPRISEFVDSFKNRQKISFSTDCMAQDSPTTAPQIR